MWMRLDDTLIDFLFWKSIHSLVIFSLLSTLFPVFILLRVSNALLFKISFICLSKKKYSQIAHKFVILHIIFKINHSNKWVTQFPQSSKISVVAGTRAAFADSNCNHISVVLVDGTFQTYDMLERMGDTKFWAYELGWRRDQVFRMSNMEEDPRRNSFQSVEYSSRYLEHLLQKWTQGTVIKKFKNRSAPSESYHNTSAACTRRSTVS